MASANAADKGKNVVSVKSRTRRLAADFPGWGSPDYAAHLLPLEDGLRGVVTNVESHGSAPFTRYGVRFEDGSTASGLVPGENFNFAR